MKKKEIPIQQYSLEGKNLDGASEDFLNKTAPLIGYIVHSFNSLEELLNESICNLINERTHSPGLIVIHKLNYSAKVDLFKRFLNDYQNVINKKILYFEKLTENLNTAGNLRNQVIHADWEHAFDDGYTLSKVKINSKGITQEYIQFTPESLIKIHNLIVETIDMFDDFEEELNNLMQNS